MVQYASGAQQAQALAHVSMLCASENVAASDCRVARLRAGTIGTMDPIPAGYSTSFVAYVGNRGINAAFEGWGNTLLQTYGKSRASFESDYVLNYLGYVR